MGVLNEKRCKYFYNIFSNNYIPLLILGSKNDLKINVHINILEYINMSKIHCEIENCRKYANYGIYHSKPIRCKEHKEEYKIISKICISENCRKVVLYNYFGNSAIFCGEHREDNMIITSGKTYKK